MKLPAGLEVLEDQEGSGRSAKVRDTAIYNVRIFLNRGDEVPINERQAELAVLDGRIRHDGDRVLIDHVMRLGSREAVAGIEKALVGMKPGGYRKVRVSPHLAYRDKGIPGLIPPNAVLIVEIWLRDVSVGTDQL